VSHQPLGSFRRCLGFESRTGTILAIRFERANERQQALDDSKGQLADTLKVLGAAASILPKQSVPLIKRVANAAKEAGVPAVAEEAQKILDTNAAVRTAAETTENIGKVYFITPEELTDNMLHELRDRIRARFPLADFQPPVHPTRRMAFSIRHSHRPGHCHKDCRYR
jgi:hypothetical protein